MSRTCLRTSGTPQALIDLPGSHYVAWPAVRSLKNLLTRLRMAAQWLTGEWSEANPTTPVVHPADVDAEHLEALRRWVEGHHDESYSLNLKLDAILRPWYLNPWMPDSLQWPDADWRESDSKKPRTGEENRTARVPQETMGPLLEWAVAFVSAFAEDILAADLAYQEHLLRLPDFTGFAEVRAFFADCLAKDRALPLSRRARGGRDSIAWGAVAYRYGLNPSSLATGYARTPFAARIPARGTPRLFPSTMRFRAPSTVFRGCRTSVCYDLARRKGGPGVLLGHLRTACLIVVAYLTGARPGEVMAFKDGAAREVLLRNGAKLHLVDGLVWKGVSRQPDGSPGEPKSATWATIPITVEAIKVAGRINKALGRPKSHPLFASGGITVSGHSHTPANWIKAFIDYVNGQLVPACADPEALEFPTTANRN